MKFLLDMPLPQRTAKWLRDQGFDVVHARDLGLERAADMDILKRAVEEKRIVLTMDLDIPAILALTQAKRPGVILFRMRDPRPPSMQERLRLIFETTQEVQLATSITVVEDYRVRIRKLPIT